MLGAPEVRAVSWPARAQLQVLDRFTTPRLPAPTRHAASGPPVVQEGAPVKGGGSLGGAGAAAPAHAGGEQANAEPQTGNAKSQGASSTLADPGPAEQLTWLP